MQAEKEHENKTLKRAATAQSNAMFGVVSAIGGAVSWEVARRAKKAAAKPAEEALAELREREKQLRKELEVSTESKPKKRFDEPGAVRPSLLSSLRCARKPRGVLAAGCSRPALTLWTRIGTQRREAGAGVERGPFVPSLAAARRLPAPIIFGNARAKPTTNTNLPPPTTTTTK